MKIKKTFKTLLIISVVFFFLFSGGVILKNFFLSQIKNKIQSDFDYDRIHMSAFPPVLVIEKLRTRTTSPYFSAEKIEMRISYRALLTKQRPGVVSIEHPVLKFYGSNGKKEKGEKTKFDYSFPFLVEEGYVREGEFHFLGKDVKFRSTGISAYFTQGRNRFSIRAEASEYVFSPGSTLPQLEGKASFLVESRGNEITIKSLKVDGSDFSLNAEGKLIDLLNPELILETSFKTRVPLVADLLQLPFEWEGEVEGEGTLTRNKEEIVFEADFWSDNLFFNKIYMGKVKGKVNSNEETGQTIVFNINKGALPEEIVSIHIKNNKIEGNVQGAYLDPITGFFSLPWPVASPVWGDFSIDAEKLRASAEFRDEYFREEPGLFPFRGPVEFSWDLKNGIFFSSQSLSSDFAHVDVSGKVYIGQDVDVTIQGDVFNVKKVREFTSLIFGKEFEFPEIRGSGISKLRIFGDYNFPQVQAEFSLSPGGFDKFEAYSVEGEFKIIQSDFMGRFEIDDPFMKGEVGVVSNRDGVEVDIRLDRGLVEKIFPALDIIFPLQGEASGNFLVIQKDKNVQLEGNFSGPLIKFLDRELSEVSGKVMWQEGVLSLSDIQFRLHEGLFKGSTSIGLSSQAFDVDIRAEGINLSSLYAGVKGELGFSLKGKGVLGQDLASGPFEIKDLHYSPLQKTEAKGEAKLGFSEGRIGLEIEGNFLPGENEFNISFDIPVHEGVFLVDIKGGFNNLDLLLPWKGAEGRVNYLAEVKGQDASPEVKGAIDFQGTVFPLQGFAHAFRDYSGLIFVENSKVTFRSLQAKLGGGDVNGSGELRLGKGGIETMDVRMEGKNLLLSPLERTRVLAEGSLNLLKDSDRFVLEGNFLAHKLSWRREIYEKFIFYSSPYYQVEKEPGFFDNLTLNIRLRAEDDAWMENSLGRIRGRFDLTIIGSVNAPVVLGDIEALSGDVYFQDRRFRVQSCRLSFFNPLTIEPYLSFLGESYVKDYRVTFSLEGLIDHLNPEFSSSPPLPPEDVLTLLAIGESFRRTYSYDISTQQSTYSLLSFQISEEAKKSAEKLFSIDRFRIDPFVLESSAEMAARLTVGKKLSKNLFILYSTNLTSQRDEIARLEWELTSDFSIVGTRDEKGRISFDVKIHKRF